jgi:hypothetical protein
MEAYSWRALAICSESPYADSSHADASAITALHTMSDTHADVGTERQHCGTAVPPAGATCGCMHQLPDLNRAGTLCCGTDCPGWKTAPSERCAGEAAQQSTVCSTWCILGPSAVRVMQCAHACVYLRWQQPGSGPGRRCAGCWAVLVRPSGRCLQCVEDPLASVCLAAQTSRAGERKQATCASC